MRTTDCRTNVQRVLLAGACVGLGTYAAYALTTWARYGHPRPRRHADPEDPELDRLMPRYDVVERHHIEVQAPAAVTFGAACEMDMSATPIARAIFKARELVMGSQQGERRVSTGFVDDMRALGWGVLAEEPGRELIMGGVTKPWEPNPVFRAIPADAFASFDEPDLVKIAFTLRVDPLDEQRSIFRTETRAVATDAAARRRFRAYWSLLSPGIVMIRWAMLRPLKLEAERRVRRHQGEPAAAPA